MMISLRWNKKSRVVNVKVEGKKRSSLGPRYLVRAERSISDELVLVTPWASDGLAQQSVQDS
jgi:hypothetical protein